MLEFLKTLEVNIPVRGISIGPIQKKDVRKASVMLEKKMLAFDVKVTPEAQKLADELGVKIFVGDIIHEVIKAYVNNVNEEREKELAVTDNEAVFPCVLKILPTCVFNKKDPIIMGVKVVCSRHCQGWDSTLYSSKGLCGYWAH
jgi:translation initiation factor 5B